MSEKLQLAKDALWPAALVSAVILAAAWPWLASRGESRRGRWAPALALGLGTLASLIKISGAWPSLAPSERWHWLLPMTIAACAIGAVAALLPRAMIIRIAAAIALGGALLLMLQPPASISNAMVWKVALGCSAIVLWLGLEPLAERRIGPALPIALWVAFAGLSLVLEQSRFALLSLTSAGASVSAAIVSLFAFIRPGLSLANGGTYVAAALLPAIAAMGLLYNRTDVPLACFILPVAAPLAVWMIEIGKFKTRERGWRSTLLAAVVAAVPAAVAVFLAMRAVAGDDLGY